MGGPEENAKRDTVTNGPGAKAKRDTVRAGTKWIFVVYGTSASSTSGRRRVA